MNDDGVHEMRIPFVSQNNVKVKKKIKNKKRKEK